MIIDLERFVHAGRPRWAELDELLARAGSGPLDLAAMRRLHHLYERASADLGRLAGLGPEADLRRHLEALVARAYAEIHGSRGGRRRVAAGAWLRRELPRTFRRQAWAFRLALAATLAGVLFGALAVALDPAAKSALMPFAHLQGDPAERVAEEEAAAGDRLAGAKTSFSAMLMTHNTRVSILALALGMSWGAGTLALLFYNGVILGAVCLDYVRAGQGVFLAGWLLPHGSVEIPAILIAGQAGLVLGGALLGWEDPRPLPERLRAAGPDVLALMAGVALLLAWAGLIEAFFSQYHEPQLPYAVKIAFGLAQLAALAGWLGWAGRRAAAEARPA